MHPYINSKKADGKLIINEKTIFYEVINQDPEEYMRKERKYTLEISNFLKDKFGSKRTFVRFKKRNMNTDVKIEKLYHILESANPPFDYEDYDIKIQIMDNDGGLTILGDILNRDKILENWIRNVHDKYDQLPPNVGGVIIANSSSLWDDKDIKIVQKISWRKIKERYKSRISGIIFCNRQMLGIPSISGERIRFVSPLLLINKYSRFDYTDELKKMASSLGSFPNWM